MKNQLHLSLCQDDHHPPNRYYKNKCGGGTNGFQMFHENHIKAHVPDPVPISIKCLWMLLYYLMIFYVFVLVILCCCSTLFCQKFSLISRHHSIEFSVIRSILNWLIRWSCNLRRYARPLNSTLSFSSPKRIVYVFREAFTRINAIQSLSIFPSYGLLIDIFT